MFHTFETFDRLEMVRISELCPRSPRPESKIALASVSQQDWLRCTQARLTFPPSVGVQRRHASCHLRLRRTGDECDQPEGWRCVLRDLWTYRITILIKFLLLLVVRHLLLVASCYY